MTEIEVTAEISRLKQTIPSLHWGRLRFIGNLRTLSVSYVLGAAVALPKLSETDISIYVREPLILWPFIVFVLSVSIANLLYDLSCPAIIKKFENLSDFYEHQLDIKKRQMETYPSDPFEANLLHVSEHYIKALGSRWAARWITLSLYVLSFIALICFVYSLYTTTVTINCA